MEIEKYKPILSHRMNKFRPQSKTTNEVNEMSMIQCDVDCVYQKDGYCQLDMPSAITNYTNDGCVHCIKVTPRSELENSNSSQPQTPVSRL